MNRLEIITAQDERDWDAAAEIDAEGFTEPKAQAMGWINLIRKEGIGRIALQDGKPAGWYLLTPATQQFGGAGVQVALVSSVAVKVAARGTGVGAALMRDLVRECRDREFALAPLWAAVPRFYRRNGWGMGHRGESHRVRMDAIAAMRGAGEVVENPGQDEWHAMWRDLIAPYDAAIIPPKWINAYESDPKDDVLRFDLGWRENKKLTGFMQFTQSRGGDGPVETNVVRFGAVTGNAHRGLLGILGGNSGQGEDVTFAAARLPHDNFLTQLIADPHHQILRTEARLAWMPRIAGTERALLQRGWNRAASGKIAFSIKDPFEDQPETFTLEIASGAPRVTSAETQTEIQTDIATFSSWYCGTLTAVQAARTGILDGPPEKLALMDQFIPHRPVWLSESF